MNYTFNLNRFKLLVKQHWSENGRRYLLFIPVIAGLLLIWFCMDGAGDRKNAMTGAKQADTFIEGLVLAGCLHAYTLLSSLNSKRKAIHYLTIPSSSLEKMLCLLFYGVFVFFIVYLLVFYIVDIPLVYLAKKLGNGYEMMARDGNFNGNRPKRVIDLTVSDDSIGYSVRNIPVFFCIQAAFMLGTIYFRRYSLLKTTIIVTILLFMIGYILQIPRSFLPPSVWTNPGFLTWTSIDWPTSGLTLAAPSWMISLLQPLILTLLPPALWYITLIRLQEKEV